MQIGEHVYSFHRGFKSDNALDFSKRSSFDCDVMLERVYPTRIILPMLQHCGDECVPTVRIGDHVTIGQCVGAPAPGSFAVPIHSGISGNVTSIKPITMPAGNTCQAVYIESDRKRTFHSSIRPRNDVNISAAQVMGIVRDSGVVGMGGEGIPTIAKLNRARKLKVKQLLVNCLQSEPYAASDYLRIGEYADYIIMGAVAMAGVCGVRVINILISKEHKYEITALKSAMERSCTEYSGYAFNFKFMKQRYPQGYYRMVARALYGVELKENETLEEKCGAVLFNCSTIYSCWEAIKDGIPLTSRVISISTENGISHNVLAPIGTPVSELLDSVNGMTNTSKRIIWGNHLTGIEISNPNDVPVIKTTSGVCVVNRNEVSIAPCSGCGKCVDACPMRLEPVILHSLLISGKQDKADEFFATRCISCGACSYVCPSGLDLTGVIAAYASSKRSLVRYPYSSVNDRINIGTASLLEAYTEQEQVEQVQDANAFTLPFEGGKIV